MRMLESKFDDFNEIQFSDQIERIYLNVTNALLKREYPILMRSLFNMTVSLPYHIIT
jgi:hypothetical protein